MRKTALLMDGGLLRDQAGYWKLPHQDALFVNAVALKAFDLKEEEIFRIFYYDCPPFRGQVTTPIGRVPKLLGPTRSDDWLHEIGCVNFFAVRLGICKFRGWTLKEDRYQYTANGEFTDEDFRPVIEQKQVDMRIGLDIAVLADTGSVERIIIMSGDTDLIPAVKHGRKSGIQMVLAVLPKYNPARDFPPYFDICRKWINGRMAMKNSPRRS